MKISSNYLSMGKITYSIDNLFSLRASNTSKINFDFCLEKPRRRFRRSRKDKKDKSWKSADNINPRRKTQGSASEGCLAKLNLNQLPISQVFQEKMISFGFQGNEQRYQTPNSMSETRLAMESAYFIPVFKEQIEPFFQSCSKIDIPGYAKYKINTSHTCNRCFTINRKSIPSKTLFTKANTNSSVKEPDTKSHYQGTHSSRKGRFVYDPEKPPSTDNPYSTTGFYPSYIQIPKYDKDGYTSDSSDTVSSSSDSFSIQIDIVPTAIKSSS